MPALLLPTQPVMFLLQNQWFKDPDRARKALSKCQEHKGVEWGWNRFVRDMLFMGGLTGRRIRAHFGSDLCEDWAMDGRVVFEETSREMGGRSDAVFPPDPVHLEASLRRYRPRIIVCFGLVAKAALQLPPLQPLLRGVKIVHAPHPASRGSDVEGRLGAAAGELSELL